MRHSYLSIIQFGFEIILVFYFLKFHFFIVISNHGSSEAVIKIRINWRTFFLLHGQYCNLWMQWECSSRKRHETRQVLNNFTPDIPIDCLHLFWATVTRSHRWTMLLIQNKPSFLDCSLSGCCHFQLFSWSEHVALRFASLYLGSKFTDTKILWNVFLHLPVLSESVIN